MIRKHIYINLIRSKLKTVLIVLVSCILFLVSYEYQHTINIEKQELETMYQTIPVEGELSAVGVKNKEIPLAMIDDLENTGFIKEEQLETLYYAYEIYPVSNLSITFTEDGVFHNNLDQGKVVGVSDFNQMSYMPKGTKVEFMEGFCREDFKTDQAICLVSKNDIESSDVSYGDKIILMGEYIPENYHVNPLDGMEQFKNGITFTVCGSYELPKDFRMEQWNNIEYIVPARALLNHLEDYFINEEPPVDIYYNHMHNIITKPYVYSAKFVIQDTKHLPEFRSFLIKQKLLTGEESTSAYTFELEDDNLTNSTKPLLQSIEFKETMLLFLLVLVCVLSFFVSLITTHKRIYYIALVRTLGLSKMKTFVQTFLEYVILGIFGILLSLLYLSLKYGMAGLNLDIKYLAIYLLCYLSGSICAIGLILHRSTMKILLKRD